MIRLLFLCFLTFLISSSIVAQFNYTYPETKKAIQKDTFFGKVIDDPYRWLEAQNSTETNLWINEENEITQRYLSEISRKFSMKDRIVKNTEVYYETPVKNGKYYFLLRRKEGRKDVSIFYRKSLILDDWMEIQTSNKINQNSEEYTSIVDFEVSSDSRYLAYTFDKNGSDWKELQIIDLNKQKIIEDHLYDIKFSDITWRGNGLYYTKYNRQNQNEQYKQLAVNGQLFYHVLGTTQDKDSLIFKKNDSSNNKFSTTVSENERYFIIEDHDPVKNTFAYFYFDFENKNQTALMPLFKKSTKDFDFLGIDGDKLLFITEIKDEKKIISVNPLNPLKWFEKVKSIEKLNVLDAYYYKNKLYELCFINQQQFIVVFDSDGIIVSKIEIPIGNSIIFKGIDENENQLLFSYNSFFHPAVYAGMNMSDFKIQLLERMIVNYKMADYEIKKIMCKSDTAMVPMLLLYKKGIRLDGNNMTLLEFYGGFGIINKPSYDAGIISFIEKGGVYAYAMIRGGGEKGVYWHKDAMLNRRQNSINDVINCTKYLFENSYTNPAKMSISGGSHGGLIAAAVAMQKPDMFAAVVPVVGVYDMLRFEKFTIGSSHTDEYGSIKDSISFYNLLSFSPLHNIKEKLKYPAMLFMTSDFDDRVPPLHSYKMVATLQNLASKENPILLRVEKNAGHNGSRNYYSYINETTDFYNFILYNLGYKEYK